MGQQYTIRLGTRGSQLAIAQANHIKNKIIDVDSTIDVRITIIRTKGDECDDPIDQMGEGVFVKDIEQALLNLDIDIAVHSFKDITSTPHPDLAYSGFISEERATDAFILFNHDDVKTKSLRLATGSLRRKSLCAHLFPNIECVPMRGNIDSRITTAKALSLDGLILSTAGLQRIRQDHFITFEPDPLQFIPAPGQGMLAIQNRTGDKACEQVIKSIIDPKGHELGIAYFKFLNGIQFNCNHPLGAIIHNNEWHVFLGHHGPHYFKHPVNDVDGIIHQIKGIVNE